MIKYLVAHSVNSNFPGAFPQKRDLGIGHEIKFRGITWYDININGITVHVDESEAEAFFDVVYEYELMLNKMPKKIDKEIERIWKLYAIEQGCLER